MHCLVAMMLEVLLMLPWAALHEQALPGMYKGAMAFQSLWLHLICLILLTGDLLLHQGKQGSLGRARRAPLT